jgi:uncharacterized protein YkwD
VAAADTAVADPAAVQGLAVPLEPVALEGSFTMAPVQLPPGATAAEQLFIYVNEARRLFELPPLAYAQELSAAAQYHTQDKAYYPDAFHTGTDGTAPAERLLRHGFAGGYAGEATAWGFPDAREAVEFWINSDAHRSIILNRYATDVGVGYTEDYETRNVWHWTAEFGNRYGSPVQPVVRLHEPSSGANALDTEILNYGWMWPLPLASDQVFVVYLQRGDEQLPLGRLSQPVYGSRFVLSAALAGSVRPETLVPLTAGTFNWFVRLEDGRGATLAESEQRMVTFQPDPNAPTATPDATATANFLVTATPVVTPGASPTPSTTPMPSTVPTFPLPTDNVPPPIVTATPRSSPEP